jgi:hypothetical protein
VFIYAGFVVVCCDFSGQNGGRKKATKQKSNSEPGNTWKRAQNVHTQKIEQRRNKTTQKKQNKPPKHDFSTVQR